MLAAERRHRIATMVQSQGRGEVKELAHLFGVSMMTIRRDLERLAEDGLLTRTFGGALPPTRSTAYELPYRTKAVMRIEEKQRIGEAVAALVHDGETILLDSGSTTLEVARHLGRLRDLVIITNDLKVAMELAGRHGITVMDTGGILQPTVYTLLGPQTESFLRSIRVNRTFLGADAIDLEHGIMNRTLLEVPVKQAMVEAAEEVVVVADSSKFGQLAFASVCPVSRVHHIITDSAVAPAVVEAVQEMGVRMTTV